MIAGSLDVGPTRWRARTGVVVVGSGAAGCSAALGLVEAGVTVDLVTKERLDDGATAWAQGGLAAVTDPADSVADHVADTLAAGAGLCDADVVRELASAAPEAIDRLTARGVAFDRDADGALSLGLEGGHRARRIVHAGGDASGAAVVAALVAAVRGSGVRVHERALAVDALLDEDGAVGGLRLIDSDGAVGELSASAVVLATGGIGQAWPVTSNPTPATGDGLALALRAGAIVRDVEFVQFHPTVVVSDVGGLGRAALVSEAVRGEGARLLDVDGAAVTAGMHPLGDLAPRDVVSAAIHARMAATGADHVLLDATAFGERRWRQRFPTILALCRERGIDPVSEPIPVAPAAHYACGGVLADLDGVTTVTGLSAIGEVASTGVQGANRLASNGVTEAVIAGGRLAARLVGAPVALGSVRPPSRRGVAPFAPLDPRTRGAVVRATGAGSGVLRDAAGLHEQLGTLSTLAAFAPGGHGDLRRAVEATNLHAVSTLVATAALRRTESRGCHRRSDFPEASAAWHEHQLLALRDGELEPLSESVPVAA